jgi:hypothetical protein
MLFQPFRGVESIERVGRRGSGSVDSDIREQEAVFCLARNDAAG